MTKTPDKLRQKAEQARENDEFEKALALSDQAIVAAQKQKNYEVVIDALKDKVITWKHFYLLDQEKTYFLLARKTAETALKISQEHNLKSKLHSAYFLLGEVSMLDQDYAQAIKHYQKSLEVYQGPLSEKGDYRHHLGEALYKSGKKQKGLKAIKKGIKEIKKGQSEVDDFFIHVWLSGAHLRLTELLHRDNPEKAKLHAQKARSIINSDDRLIIRKRQFQKLLEKTNLKL